MKSLTDIIFHLTFDKYLGKVQKIQSGLPNPKFRFRPDPHLSLFLKFRIWQDPSPVLYLVDH